MSVDKLAGINIVPPACGRAPEFPMLFAHVDGGACVIPFIEEKGHHGWKIQLTCLGKVINLFQRVSFVAESLKIVIPNIHPVLNGAHGVNAL